MDPGWSAYNQAYKGAVKGWIRDYPGAPYFSRGDAWSSAIREDDTISEKEGMEALDCYLKAHILYDSPAAWYFLNAAGFLIEHKWQSKRALELLNQAQSLLAKEQARDAANDNRSAQQQEEMKVRRPTTGRISREKCFAQRVWRDSLKRRKPCVPPSSDRRQKPKTACPIIG